MTRTLGNQLELAPIDEDVEPWAVAPLEPFILSLPVGPAALAPVVAPTAEELGEDASWGSCHICIGAGIVEDFDGDRDCTACSGTGDITKGSTCPDPR